MGKITGFLEIEREDRDYQPVADRVKHWHEFVLPLPEKELRDQAARCMPSGARASWSDTSPLRFCCLTCLCNILAVALRR